LKSLFVLFVIVPEKAHWGGSIKICIYMHVTDTCNYHPTVLVIVQRVRETSTNDPVTLLVFFQVAEKGWKKVKIDNKSLIRCFVVLF